MTTCGPLLIFSFALKGWGPRDSRGYVGMSNAHCVVRVRAVWCPKLGAAKTIGKMFGNGQEKTGKQGKGWGKLGN